MAAPVAQPPNVYQQSAGAYTGALQGTQGAMTGMPNIGAFMNPFTQAVVDPTMQAMERARQMSMNQLGAQATNARAFGGSRQGVAEGETNRAFFDQAGQTLGNLYNTGFNTALGAAQQQQGTQLQAAGQLGNLSNLGFGYGQQIGQQQMQQGQLQQAMNQALIDAAKGQYGGFTGAPQNALATQLAALTGANMGQQTQTATSTSKPGLMDFLTAGATFAGGLCWVAREVYGEEDGRWVQFRTWLLNDAPKWLLNLYATHGERFAGVVRRAPILKRALRPLMDRARRAAGFVG
jgi:hypothetical protein